MFVCAGDGARGPRVDAAAEAAAREERGEAEAAAAQRAAAQAQRRAAEAQHVAAAARPVYLGPAEGEAPWGGAGAAGHWEECAGWEGEDAGEGETPGSGAGGWAHAWGAAQRESLEAAQARCAEANALGAIGRRAAEEGRALRLAERAERARARAAEAEAEAEGSARDSAGGGAPGVARAAATGARRGRGEAGAEGRDALAGRNGSHSSLAGLVVPEVVAEGSRDFGGSEASDGSDGGAAR